MNITAETLDKLFSNYRNIDRSERRGRIRGFALGIVERMSDYETAIVVLAAIEEGTDPRHLAEFCVLPLSFVVDISKRMMLSGLWLADGRVDYDFQNINAEQGEGLMLACDLLIAQGVVARTKDQDGGYMFNATEANRWEHASRKREQLSIIQ